MPLSLSIYFDFSCPYCYIAWQFMKRVKETTEIKDNWVTWEIHPGTPHQGEHIENVVHGVKLEERRLKLNQLGAPVGIQPGDHVFIPNTKLALEAVEYAKECDKMHAWIDAVYQANFVQGKNIGELEVVLAIARQIGIDDNVLKDKLETSHYSNSLLEHDRECVEKKVEWVPTIFAGNDKVLEGAFTYDNFVKTLLEYNMKGNS